MGDIPYEAKINNQDLRTYVSQDKGLDQRVKPKGIKKMVNLKETAEKYEAEQMVKNIADCDLIPVDVDVFEKEFERKNPKEGEEPTFKINVIEVNGQLYRMPNSVLASLKVILQKKPDLKEFSVGKTGEGLNTEYTVVPM